MNNRKSDKENETVPAAFLQRLKAFGWDYLFISAYILVLLGFGLGLIEILGPPETFSPLFESPWVLDGMAFVLLVLPAILCFALQEAASGATWGKRRVGLRVMRANGSGLNFSQALLRAAVKFLPWQLAHTGIYQSVAAVEGVLPAAAFFSAYLLAGIYIAAVLIRGDRRTPYDLVSGSVVVRADDEISLPD